MEELKYKGKILSGEILNHQGSLNEKNIAIALAFLLMSCFLISCIFAIGLVIFLRRV